MSKLNSARMRAEIGRYGIAPAHMAFIGDPALGFHKLASGIPEARTVKRKSESDAARYIFDLFQEIYGNLSKKFAKAATKMYFATSNRPFPYFRFPAIYLTGSFLHGE